MAHVFISYARIERAVVVDLASLLEQQGWQVWWDTNLHGGQEFRSIIEQEIAAA